MGTGIRSLLWRKLWALVYGHCYDVSYGHWCTVIVMTQVMGIGIRSLLWRKLWALVYGHCYDTSYGHWHMVIVMTQVIGTVIRSLLWRKLWALPVILVDHLHLKCFLFLISLRQWTMSKIAVKSMSTSTFHSNRSQCTWFQASTAQFSSVCSTQCTILNSATTMTN
jgi:hypothetical protein